MSQLVYRDHGAIIVALSIYSAKIEAAGGSFPCHPKRQGQVAVGDVAAAIGLDPAVLQHPSVRAHLAKISAGRVADPVVDRARANAARIANCFANRPLPRRGRSGTFHLTAVSVISGVAVKDLKTGACKAALTTLVDRDWWEPVVRDEQGELSALERYASTLREAHRALPGGCSGKPAISIIADACGIHPQQFQYKKLRDELARLAAEMGVEDVSLASDVAALAMFVNDAIATGKPIPRISGRTNKAQIAVDVGIEAHRLTNNTSLKHEIERWAAASGPDR